MDPTTRPRCLCEMCSPEAPAQTWTRAWAMTCEARMLAALSIQARRAYLEKPIVQARRQELERMLIEMWRQKREPRPPE